MGRLQESGVAIYAGPGHAQPGNINHLYGGWDVYCEDPDGHRLELITAAYGEHRRLLKTEFRAHYSACMEFAAILCSLRYVLGNGGRDCSDGPRPPQATRPPRPLPGHRRWQDWLSAYVGESWLGGTVRLHYLSMVAGCKTLGQEFCNLNAGWLEASLIRKCQTPVRPFGSALSNP